MSAANKPTTVSKTANETISEKTKNALMLKLRRKPAPDTTATQLFPAAYPKATAAAGIMLLRTVVRAPVRMSQTTA